MADIKASYEVIYLHIPRDTMFKERKLSREEMRKRNNPTRNVSKNKVQKRIKQIKNIKDLNREIHLSTRSSLRPGFAMRKYYGGK